MSGLSRDIGDRRLSGDQSSSLKNSQHSAIQPTNHRRKIDRVENRHRDDMRAVTYSEPQPEHIDDVGLLNRLVRAIESEIIPRLLLANRALPGAFEDADDGTERFSGAIIDELTAMAVHGSVADTLGWIQRLRDCGTPLDAIFLDLLAPCARRLGEAWNDDILTFAEVSLGLVHLQDVLRRLGSEFERHTCRPGPVHCIALIAARNEQHSFGLMMLEIFFRRAGWHVVPAAGMTIATLTNVIRSEWIDVVGISKSGDSLLDTLASDIRNLRSASRNKNLTVMVGGQAFLGHPERIILVGADASARDGQQAVLQANHCVRAAARP